MAYPLALELAGRRAVVVGGGPVALRRAGGLTAAGAQVLVIAPRIVAGMPGTWLQRGYADGDLAGAWLVHACTDSARVNDAVAAEAERRGVWCVRADAGGTASLPAVAATPEVTVAVWGGGDPGRARAVRDAVSYLLDTAALPVRPTRPGGGRVALVGGGPGDPGLLTLRGRQLLAQADVVVADRLGNRAVLAELDPDVEVCDVGKSRGDGAAQADITELLVRLARQGRRVVRLKGGDPFVFGRGGEEMQACLAAGLEVEVVPGVSSAIAAPAAAGIPVTHRGLATQVTFVSAHLPPGHPESTVDWEALARTRGTVVLLMAVNSLVPIAAALLDAGRAPATPVAVIERGTTPQQRVTRTDLAGLAAVAPRVSPPAVVVLGAVAALGQ